MRTFEVWAARRKHRLRIEEDDAGKRLDVKSPADLRDPAKQKKRPRRWHTVVTFGDQPMLVVESDGKRRTYPLNAKTAVRVKP